MNHCTWMKFDTVKHGNTVKPLSFVSEGTVENRRWMCENDSCRKAF
jgi:hypothetical protein